MLCLAKGPSLLIPATVFIERGPYCLGFTLYVKALEEEGRGLHENKSPSNWVPYLVQVPYFHTALLLLGLYSTCKVPNK